MSNNPPIIVEFTQEEAEFILRNCNSNIAFALSALPTADRALAEKLVGLIEQFKDIKEKVNDAIEL